LKYRRILAGKPEVTQFAADGLYMAEPHVSRNTRSGEEFGSPKNVQTLHDSQSQAYRGNNRHRLQPACTVVVCTRNRPSELNSCLQGLAQLVYPRFGVLVVDNAPSDDQAREIAVHWGADYVVEPVPGLSRARNRGAHACSAEIIAYLDDDSIPEPNWLSALVEEFTDPLVMAVTGHSNALKVETEAERLCAMAAAPSPNGHGRRVVDCHTAHWFDIANFGGLGDGMNMAFRRGAFDLWPGFDERLGRGALIDGAEEHYAFFSLLELGYRVVHTPIAVVYHPFPRAMKQLRRRNLQDAASTAAYITLLLAENPGYRRMLLRYLFEGLQGKRRIWRNSAGQSHPVIAPRWRQLLAAISGPLLYARLRFERRVNLEPPSVVPLPVDRFTVSGPNGRSSMIES
jgi:O-antigen biosynthesis protein